MGKIKLWTVFIGVLLLGCIFVLAGCQNVGGLSGGGDPRQPLPVLGFKSPHTIFEIDDVTLTFYVGSENACGGMEFQRFPTVTYIYFANEITNVRQYYPVTGELVVNNKEIDFKYAEGYEPKDLYRKIETDTNFNICKKILSSNSDAFYKNNTVTLQFEDAPYIQGNFVEEDLWGEGNALYKITTSFTNGIYIPTISYDFSIPSKMFTNDKGCVFFSMASYLAEEYYVSTNDYHVTNDFTMHAGDLFESRDISIYYQKNENVITLSSYYEEEN